MLPVAAWSASAGAQALPSASAQPGAKENTGGLAEIIVTAQRRSENLQKVPIAVAVTTAAQIKSLGLSTVRDLKMAMPGVEVQQNAGFAIPVIRGVGSKVVAAGFEPPVAFYVDGVYYAAPSASLSSFNNVERIEVLKGPQGTLFGRNATGGLIQIVTPDPKSRFEGNGDLSYGNFETVTGHLYVTGPISSSIAADLAVSGATQGHGWGENLQTGNDTYRDKRDISIRSKWLFNISASTTLRLTGDYNDRDGSMNALRLTPGTTAPPPFGPSYGGSPWDTDTDTDFYVKNKSGGISAKLDSTIGDLRLSSITAYRRSDNVFQADFDYTATRGRSLNVDIQDRQFSQELQLASSPSSRLKWTIGAFYFDARSELQDFNLGLFGPSVINAPPSPIVQLRANATEYTHSYAAFGQATYPLTDWLNFTGGLRYTIEKHPFTGTNYAVRQDGSITVTVPRFDTSVTARRLTWRFALDANVSRDVLLYASYNRGFKSGGFNTTAITLPAFRPETLDAYEVGAKTQMFDRKVRLNGAAFFYDYKDMQVNQAVLGGVGIYNGGRAHIYGLDLDLTAQVTRNLDVGVAYEYLHGRYEKFDNAQIAVPNPPNGYLITVGDVAGNTTILSPKSTISAHATYAVPIGSDRLSFTGVVHYNSGYYDEPDNLVKEKRYALINASVRYDIGDRWWVKLWGDNLTDHAVSSFTAIQTFGNSGALRSSYDAPRTYGGTIGLAF
jgi:outer membrane receptor protein involved in Fe transport